LVITERSEVNHFAQTERATANVCRNMLYVHSQHEARTQSAGARTTITAALGMLHPTDREYDLAGKTSYVQDLSKTFTNWKCLVANPRSDIGEQLILASHCSSHPSCHFPFGIAMA